MQRNLGLAVRILTGVTLLSSGCNGGGGGAKRVNAGGSSFIAPMEQKWSSEYNKAQGIQVNYASVGSGAGIDNMIKSTYDFGCTDAPMKDSQIEEAKKTNGDVVHIPLLMGAVVPAYSLPGVSKPLNFSGALLADIFLGKVTKWNDKAVQDLNEGVPLPDLRIAVCHRADGSGTTYIFTDFLSKVSSEWKETIGYSTTVKFPVGVGAKGNEGVANYVKDNRGSITYVELLYALQNKEKVQFGAVQNREGNFILGSLEGVTAAADALAGEVPADLRYSLTNAPGKESYPIAGTTWAVLYVHQPAEKKQRIVDYLRWCTHEGQQHCAELHYAPLPRSIVEKLDRKLDAIQAK